MILRSDISKNSTRYYLRNWAYMRQKSGQYAVTEWSEYWITTVIELSTIKNSCLVFFFGHTYEF